MISNDLTWLAQTERRCEKTMKAFFTIKRNIANGTPWTTRKNLYRSYIVKNYLMVQSFGNRVKQT